jgi:hypothetical protein
MESVKVCERVGGHRPNQTRRDSYIGKTKEGER